MTKIYFYPKIELKKDDIQNSYASDFENALSIHNEVVNKKFNSRGVLDFFKYLRTAEIYIFNWIEEIPRRRYGKLQVLFFIVFLVLRKFTGNKIIWVLHNRYSHNTKQNFWTDFMFDRMMKKADLILTHSHEGVEFVKTNYPKHVKKVVYEIHPIKARLKTVMKEKKYDFFFWGTIHPYKNIVKFLKFAKAEKSFQQHRILIVGRCYDQNYEDELVSCLTENVTYENKFYEMDAIADFAAQSQYTMFTYSSDSVLSSGALMDTLRMNTEIVGPNHGAFKDLAYLPNVHIFDKFSDIVQIVKDKPEGNEASDSKIENFFENNSWRAFADKIDGHIKRLTQ